MKSNTPAHPHTATTAIYRQTNGNLIARVDIEIRVPSRVSALLPENGGVHVIPSAGIGKPELMKTRAHGWKRSHRQLKTRPLESYLEPTTAEGCDTPIQIRITPEEWHLVGLLCGKIGITPGQWFVACAAYNAEVEESIIDRQLAAVSAVCI